MRPARCAAGTCDHNCSGKCFYETHEGGGKLKVTDCGSCIRDPHGNLLSTFPTHRIAPTRFAHPVQLMVGAPLGPDMNSIVYWVRKALEAHYADDYGSALREPMGELQKLIDMLPK